MRSKNLYGLTSKFLWLINYITVDTMDKISEIYKFLQIFTLREQISGQFYLKTKTIMRGMISQAF